MSRSFRGEHVLLVTALKDGNLPDRAESPYAISISGDWEGTFSESSLKSYALACFSPVSLKICILEMYSFFRCLCLALFEVKEARLKG